MKFKLIILVVFILQIPIFIFSANNKKNKEKKLGLEQSVIIENKNLHKPPLNFFRSCLKTSENYRFQSNISGSKKVSFVEPDYNNIFDSANQDSLAEEEALKAKQLKRKQFKAEQSKMIKSKLQEIERNLFKDFTDTNLLTQNFTNCNRGFAGVKKAKIEIYETGEEYRDKIAHFYRNENRYYTKVAFATSLLAIGATAIAIVQYFKSCSCVDQEN